MERRKTERPLDSMEMERNRLISRSRSPGERLYSVVKRIFEGGRILVTTVIRVHIKMVIMAIAYDLYQLCTLKKAKIIQGKRMLSKDH
jgi:transposase, IS5 family